MNLCKEKIKQSLDLEKKLLDIRLTGKNKDQAKSLQKESDRLWDEAKELGRKNVSKLNYEDLACAIIKSAIEDYEGLISGEIDEDAECNHQTIEIFLKEQPYIKLDTDALLKKVRNTYFDSFIPYARAHAEDIRQEWAEYDRKRYTVEERTAISRHRCPLCGGALRPKKRGSENEIGCTGCYLVYKPYLQKPDWLVA